MAKKCNINDLVEYFNSIDIPESLQLNDCTYIFDLNKCINSNIQYLMWHPGNKTYMPYFTQLVEIKEKLQSLSI